MSRITKDQWAMKLAATTAKRSTCCRRNVGCALLNKRGHVLATGYNGVAAGLPHCNDGVEVVAPGVVGVYTLYKNACPGAYAPSGTDLDGCNAIHAEQNALLQCRDVWDIYACYVTASPCVTCCKLLLNTSCQVIIYSEEYPHSAAKELWVGAGREWFSYEGLSLM